MITSAKPGLIAVVGATATGKTAVGVELALALGGEVVNGDSRLFYRSMDIATAKPSQAEMKGVPHHLINILDPDEQFNLAEYLARARRVIGDISERGKLPILVGGSGQYIWALIEGWEVPEIKPNLELRAELEQRLESEGVEALAFELSEMASDVAANTDLQNPRRVIRAIERVRSNPAPAKPDSTHRKPDDPPFNTLMIGLTVERPALHKRVADRLTRMLENGWQAEVQSLLAKGYSDTTRTMSGIGYRQMVGHISGEIDLAEAVRLTTVATNRLIRHQNNWFKQDDPRIQWHDMTEDADSQVKSIVETAGEWRSSSA